MSASIQPSVLIPLQLADLTRSQLVDLLESRTRLLIIAKNKIKADPDTIKRINLEIKAIQKELGVRNP